MGKQLFAIASLLICLSQAKLDRHPVRHDIVEQVKEANTSWKPKEVAENHLAQLSLDQIHGKLGNISGDHQIGSKMTNKLFSFKNYISSKLYGSDDEEHSMPDGIIIRPEEEEQSGIPDNWDWREQMPECVGQIEDQEICGACWAFSSAGMLSDRFCIHSQGQIKTRLSVQEMLDCNFENFGCQGGYLLTAIDYLQIEGTVSRQCLPYVSQTQWCGYQCQDKSMEYDKYYCKEGSLVIATNYDQMKYNLIAKGPMMVGLMMYEDFMSYESGIYQHVTGEIIGGHAMKLVGYGTDPIDGLYWILQNQWSDQWGEAGFVRIKHAQIGIDSLAMACDPDII